MSVHLQPSANAGAPNATAVPDSPTLSAPSPAHVRRFKLSPAPSAGSVDSLDDTQNCMICFVPFKHGADMYQLPCNHRFHRECVKKYLLIKGECPKCRRSLKQTWEPDNASDTCRQCCTSFGFFTRRHHCRICGKLHCDDCCPRTNGITSDHRVCVDCKEGMGFAVKRKPRKALPPYPRKISSAHSRR